MGLVYNLVLGIPVKLSKEIMLRLRDEIDKERLITEESIKAKLQQLQLMLQESELSEEQYSELESSLIQRLRAVREYQRQKES